MAVREPYRREVQVVFQDPYSSLSPSMRVGEIIAEPLQIHTSQTRAEQHERVSAVLELVGLRPVVAKLFPHDSSGAPPQASHAPVCASTAPLANRLPSTLTPAPSAIASIAVHPLNPVFAPAVICWPSTITAPGCLNSA